MNWCVRSTYPDDRSKVIETLQTHCLVTRDLILYHYCQFSGTTTLTSEKLIGTLTSMLLKRLPHNMPLPESMNDLFTKYKSSYPSIKELEELFCELCNTYPQVFIVIDGLDEMFDRKPFLEWLNDLGFNGRVFKIFVTSRQEADIELAFGSYLSVPITALDIRHDMETYVQQRLEQLEIGDDEEMDRQAIVQELVERAGEM